MFAKADTVKVLGELNEERTLDLEREDKFWLKLVFLLNPKNSKEFQFFKDYLEKLKKKIFQTQSQSEMNLFVSIQERILKMAKMTQNQAAITEESREAMERMK